MRLPYTATAVIIFSPSCMSPQSRSAERNKPRPSIYPHLLIKLILIFDQLSIFTDIKALLIYFDIIVLSEGLPWRTPPRLYVILTCQLFNISSPIRN